MIFFSYVVKKWIQKKIFISIAINLIKKKKDYIAFCNERASSIPGQNFTTPRVDHTPSYEAPFVRWILKASDVEAELKK